MDTAVPKRVAAEQLGGNVYRIPYCMCVCVCACVRVHVQSSWSKMCMDFPTYHTDFYSTHHLQVMLEAPRLRAGNLRKHEITFD